MVDIRLKVYYPCKSSLIDNDIVYNQIFRNTFAVPENTGGKHNPFFNRTLSRKYLIEDLVEFILRDRR